MHNLHQGHLHLSPQAKINTVNGYALVTVQVLVKKIHLYNDLKRHSNCGSSSGMSIPQNAEI